MPRKLCTSTALIALLVAAVATSASPVQAGANCFGEPATKTVGAGASGHVYGTQGDDVIVGTIGHDSALVVHGRDGADRICVNSQGAALKIEGNAGRDKLRGDRAQFFGGPGGDKIIDWFGSGFAEGGPGNDRLLDEGGSGDSFYGQDGDDYINVNPQGGYAYGGPGTDTCVGDPLYESPGCEN